MITCLHSFPADGSAKIEQLAAKFKTADQAESFRKQFGECLSHKLRADSSQLSQALKHSREGNPTVFFCVAADGESLEGSPWSSSPTSCPRLPTTSGPCAPGSEGSASAAPSSTASSQASCVRCNMDTTTSCVLSMLHLYIQWARTIGNLNKNDAKRLL